MPNLPKLTAIKLKDAILAKRLKTFKSPSISRFIPELRLFVISFISGLVLLGILAQTIILLNNFNQLKQLTQQRQQLIQEITYWHFIEQKYQGYTDANLKIAELQYRLGNTSEARYYIQKAFTINPNTTQGKVLGDKIHL